LFLQDYLMTHMYGNAARDDLWNKLSEVCLQNDVYVCLYVCVNTCVCVVVCECVCVCVHVSFCQYNLWDWYAVTFPNTFTQFNYSTKET